MRPHITFLRRGARVTVADHRACMTLLDWLRLEEGSVGTKEGCAEGDCGACTVVLAREADGRVVHQPVNACILLLGQADGAQVVTIEDLAGADGTLNPVQDAMVRHHGSQCGFCTPGIVMSLFAQHEDAARPLAREAVCDQLAGNLCRCTGYRPIIDAALDAASLPPAGSRDAATPDRLRALQDDADVLVGDDGAFFAAPRSEATLAALLARHPDAQIVAGTTDVGLWITKALMEPRRIVWLGRVRGLDEIAISPATAEGKGELVIGATATLGQLASQLAGPHLATIAADLGEVVRRFGSVQVRNCATVGGNIANGSPIGDLAPCLIALGATLELIGPSGPRAIPLEDFFIAYKQQDRRPGEYVRRVRVPLPSAAHRFHAYKISKRTDEDISAVMGAFAFEVSGSRIVSARIAFGGMAGTPARARRTEPLLAGIDLGDRTSWQPALETLHAEFAPLTDHRATAGYRKLVARNLLEKGLTELAGASPGATRLGQAGEAQHAAE